MKRIATSALITTMALSLQVRAADEGQDKEEIETAQDPTTVITPSRMRQSLQDVSGAITVLTGENLHLYGIRNIPDALRLVPGMEVTQITGSIYTINYHGTNMNDARRLNVLIDGVSVYQPGLAVIDWSMLPIAMEDISRIEVTRGPDSASYGPNSMMAVINIITVHPQDTESAFVRVGTGTDQARKLFTRVSKEIGPTTASLSVSGERDGGFAAFNEDPAGHDTIYAKRVQLHTVTMFSGDTTLALNGSYVSGVEQNPFTSAVSNSYQAYPDQKESNYTLSAVFKTELNAYDQLQVSANRSQFVNTQTWTACYPTAAFLPQLFGLYSLSPTYANTIAAGKMPTGGTPTENAMAASAIGAIAALGTSALTPACGTANSSVLQRRDDLEVQNTGYVTDKLRYVVGAGERSDYASSQTYLNGSAQQNYTRLFGHAEYKPTPKLIFNAGWYGEWSGSGSKTQAPEFGANYQMTAKDTLRVKVSTGVRAPDLVEKYGFISYALQPNAPIPGISNPVFYQNAKGNVNLNYETERSRELGYLHIDTQRGFMFDVKAFDDTLTNLISQAVTVAQFPPNNAGFVHLSGVELSSSFKFSASAGGFANYAYLNSSNASSKLEQAQYARNTGNLGVYKHFSGGIVASLLYTGSSNEAVGGSRYGKLDGVLSKNFQGGVSASLKLSRLNSAFVQYQGLVTPNYGYFPSRYQAYTELSYKL